MQNQQSPYTGLLLLTKAQSILSRRSWKPGQKSELGRLPRSKELAVENKKEPQPSGLRHQKV